MHRFRFFIVLTIAVMLARPSSADDNQKAVERALERAAERFSLWTECRPVYLQVTIQTPKKNKLRLTEDRISTHVRSRLRSARIFAEDLSIPPKLSAAYSRLRKAKAQKILTEEQLKALDEFVIKSLVEAPRLGIYINVVGSGFSLKLVLKKRVHEQFSDTYFPAITWEKSYTGTVSGGGSGGDYILSGVSEGIDAFIDEYLRVNSEACNPAR